jgi:xylan 1,4-beta-xylosidase
MSTLSNPILPGCFPDPSICRVGDEYFLVNSSFAYFPGLPIHRSTDLIRWELIGHVLDRETQLPLSGYAVSDGVWAPTIRHRDGVWYVVFTIANRRRGEATYVVTATDPAGPWSDPVRLEAVGIDPSLFFDEAADEAWLIAARDSTTPGEGPGEIYARRFDPESLELTGPEHVLWHGAMRGVWIEAPHLYRHGGRFHLIVAEGGTERFHAVTAAQSDAVTGPYATDRRSPLLTHRHISRTHPIQNVGHADLVQAPDGRWWSVLLGTRPVLGGTTLGRETFLVPVEWEDGFVFAPDLGLVADTLQLGGSGQPEPSGSARAGDWVGLRGPVERASSRRGSAVDLAVTPETLAGRGTPAFLARRQSDIDFELSTTVELVGCGGLERAGLAVFLDERHHIALTLGSDHGAPVQISGVVGGQTILVEGERPSGRCELRVCGDAAGFRFFVRSPGGWVLMHETPRLALAADRADAFVGVLIGLYATSDRQPTSAHALFRGVDVRWGSDSRSPRDDHGTRASTEEQSVLL